MRDVDAAARVVLVDPVQWPEIAEARGVEMRKPTRAEVEDLRRVVAEWVTRHEIVRVGEVCHGR